LAGATVNLAGQSASLLLASTAQINGQTPFNIPLNTEAQLTVQRGNAISVPLPVVVATAAPAVFTQDGSGQGAGVISDAASGVLNTPGNPAQAGDMVVISCTGLGTAGVDNPVMVMVGAQPAQVVSAFPAVGMPGVYQVTVVVPGGVSGDAVPVIVVATGQVSPAVTMAVR
jgi:uncharacterized protein (TIGR03437 family)